MPEIPFALEKIEEVGEFSREKKTSNHVDAILIAKLLRNTFWYSLKMDLLKIPIDKWHDSMSSRRPYEIRPVDTLLS
jgi:hypothetical protein